jgi:AcrR family transcriptional regulator
MSAAKSINPDAVRRRAAPEVRQADILDAALAEFASHGFEGARVEDVARRAKVSKGTVYLYYPTKQALFEALVRRDVGPRIGGAAAYLRGYEGPLRPALTQIVDMAVAAIQFSRLPIYPKLLIAESQRFPDLATFYHREVVGEMLGALRSVFERALQRGEISGVTPEMAAHLFMAPVLKSILWEMVFAPVEEVPFPPGPYLKAHVEVFLRGINYREVQNA